MNIDDLTPEQMERARDCKSAEEILALAKEVGYDLSDEELQSVVGGDFEHWGGRCFLVCHEAS